VKNNAQLTESDPTARKLGGLILDALDRNQQFLSAALPLKVVPPLFNRYGGGQTYGSHIDGAMRPIGGTRLRVRTDLSATLFLSAPEDYDGGELVIEDSFGERRVKLPAGDMVLYPGTTIHSVAPVTRGTRIASFFWIQSIVRDNARRALLYDLDGVVQVLGGASSAHAEAVRLAGIYHNLLRFWADS
jgi:PKHD-type hydroxylase